MADASDYFKFEIAYIECCERIELLSEAFDKFLKEEVGAKRTWDSEWCYEAPCSGIHARPDTLDVLYFDPEPAEHRGELLTKPIYDAWNERVPRLKAMKEWLDRHEYHLQDAPFEFYGDYIKRRHRRDDKRWDIMYAAYEEAVDDALDAVCHEYEQLLEDECDYFYSDEAAEEWAKWQNENELEEVC